ncbi:hypothetical protein BGZ93_000469 [Podila epicladia]|nr:hypothetical protein BGZ92_009821 [Podila epicladia]KAG0098327.1 hypothetical protein BGZ93_000469 [Podila epicladia]
MSNTRCANLIHGTTLELSNRTEPPGYRTFVALLCNSGVWVSCSMYGPLTKWASEKDDSFAWADTLLTITLQLLVNHVDKYPRNAVIGIPDLFTSGDKYVAGYVVGCSYVYGAGQVKQRREQEAGRSVTVRRGGVVWEDRKQWSSFLIVDASVVQMALMAGGCVDDLANCGMARVTRNIIDLGYDWASGDICNSILTMSEGKTHRISLSRAYVKVTAVLNRMGYVRPDAVGSVAVVSTHA